MILDVVVVDCLREDRLCQGFFITPRKRAGCVAVDPLQDIDPSFQCPDAADIGVFRVYDLSNCSVLRTQRKLGTFAQDRNALNLSLDYMNIRVGDTRDGHRGYYCLVFPAGYRLTELHTVDPFDHETDLHKKKQFERDTVLDTEQNVSSVVLGLRSRRGSFSFQLHARIENVGELREEMAYLRAKRWYKGDNPADAKLHSLRKPRRTMDRPKRRTSREEDLILRREGAKSVLWPVLLLTRWAGLRRGEASMLRWGEVNLDAGYLDVVGHEGGRKHPRLVWLAPWVVMQLRTMKPR